MTSYDALAFELIGDSEAFSSNLSAPVLFLVMF